MGRKEFLASLKPNKNSRYTGKKLDLDELKKTVGRMLVIGSLSLTILGFTGCGSKDTNSQQMDPIPVTNTHDVKVDPYEHLDSPDAILQDFKERYVKDYNEIYGTNIDAEDIELNTSYTNYLYEIDGKYVTHGAHPYETEAVLNNLGDYNYIKSSLGDIEIYQIIDKNSGKALESYAEFLSKDKYVKYPVYSGNDLDSLPKNLSQDNQNKFILGNYSDGFDIIIDTKSNNTLTADNKNKYIKFVENLDNVIESDYER